MQAVSSEQPWGFAPLWKSTALLRISDCACPHQSSPPKVKAETSFFRDSTVGVSVRKEVGTKGRLFFGEKSQRDHDGLVIRKSQKGGVAALQVCAEN